MEMGEKGGRKMKKLKEFVLGLICFLIFAVNSFSGVKFYGGVTDIEDNLISGVTVKLIGPNLQTISTVPYPDPNYPWININFEINNIPSFSVFIVQCSKSGYVNTIWGPLSVGNSDTKEFNPIISQSFYSSIIHGGTAPIHQSGKADIGGQINAFINKSGAVVSAKYMDTGIDIPNTQIRYFGDNMLPGDYNSTQSNGIFCIYNVDPGRPILITATKDGSKFSQNIVIGYPDSINITGIQEIDGFIRVISKIMDERDDPVSGANILLVGTSSSATSYSDGSFTLNNVPVISPIVLKISKSGYKDIYYYRDTFQREVSQDVYDEKGFVLISNEFYNRLLNQIGKTHISGKGDIGGSIGSIEGAIIKLYDYQGNEVNLSNKIFYQNQNGEFDPNLTSTTSSGGFIIINLDPGVYFIKGEKQDIEFPVSPGSVFSDGISVYEYEVPTLFIWAGEEIQALPSQIDKDAKEVSMLRFNLWKETEDIRVEKIVFTSKGTGNISNSISSVKLYQTNDWFKTGTISGNKIIFDNLNLIVNETGNPAKYLSLVFDFNGNANQGETFGVDILESDIIAYSCETNQIAKVDGLPVYGKMTTISESELFEFVIKPLSSLQVQEGGSEIFFIHLSTQPQSEVNVNITVSGDPDISVSPSSLTFTPQNWNIDQEVTVSAQEDDDADNGIATIIINAPGFVTAYIPVNEIDNDLPIPATISGKITYTGTKTGSIYIRLFTSPDFSGSPVKYIVMESQGDYSIFDIPPGVYYVVAMLDANENGEYDPSIDPFGIYIGNPITLNAGETKTGIDITLIDPQEVVKGDINKDGHIDISDVILCLRMAIGLDPVDIETADMNGDGEVDITDVIKILKKSIGLD